MGIKEQKMKYHCFKNKILHYIELLLVLCFVLSVALNVKFFLDNEVLTELVSAEMRVSKKEVEIITQNLHEVNKVANNATKEDKNATD